MNTKMLELKNYLKEKAIEIKVIRNNYKESQRKNDYNAYMHSLNTLEIAVWDYRHHHIAYSELRGRIRSEIECPRDGNKPNESLIDLIKEEYRNEETLRIST